MLKKFLEGLTFGGGFAIAFVTIWYLAAYMISPMLIASRMEAGASHEFSQQGLGIPPSSSTAPETTYESGKPFHELELEEQIKKSSVIAIAKYERASDGKMKAIVKEFLKKEPSTTIYYSIGDELSVC